MYADRARELIVSAGFIGSLERREALVIVSGRNKLPTANRIRFAGDPSLWERGKRDRPVGGRSGVSVLLGPAG